jgi:hypothetical protein
MSEPEKTEKDETSASRAGAAAPSEAESELAQINTVRSMAAVSLTFLLFTQILSRVGATTLAVLMPGEIGRASGRERVS